MKYTQGNKIFVWKKFGEWKPTLEGMFPDIMTPEFKDKVQQKAVDIENREYTEPFETLSGQSIESVITFEKTEKFRQIYPYVRLFHACRTKDIQSYKTKGILPSIAMKDFWIDQFRKIFLSGDYPELTEKMLQDSINKLSSAAKDLCFVIDDRWIIENCGHYLIYYGGEYLGNLIANLPIENTKKYESVLRNIGKPTVFEINLPNKSEYISSNILKELIYYMIPNWVYNIAHSKTDMGILRLDIAIDEPLSPKYICSHYPPTKINDPYNENKTYDAETGEYEDIEK